MDGACAVYNRVGMPGPKPSHAWIKLEHVPVYVLEYPTGSEKNYFEDLTGMYAEYLSWLKNTPTHHVLISDLRKLVSTARGRSPRAD